MSLRSRGWPIVGVLLALGFGAGIPPLNGRAVAQTPRLVFEGAENGVYHLSMTGLASTNANLEGSVDLEDWFALGSAAVENGQAQFAFADQESTSAWFFRGVEAPVPVPMRILAQVDTNLTAGFLLTADAGGSVTLKDKQGVMYEFTASSNLVSEAVAIQMTVITNFAEFPEHDGYRAAVRFSPEGFQFLGEAQLKITFPEQLPPEDMFGYSFENDGTGFHLVRSRSDTNQVILKMTHFSGKGVARFSPGCVPTFDKAYDGAKSAIRAAEHREAIRDVAALNDLIVKKTISNAEYEERLKANRLRKLDDIYRRAVKPFEQAAASDCAIGQAVVLAELERLARLWATENGKTKRESPYYPKIVEIAPLVRCACAGRLIERCEKEPGVSGSALLNAMEHLLLTSRIYTGRTDAQGCNLGSDEEIMDRLVAGPCFGEWEGTVTLIQINSRKGSARTPFSDSWVRTETYDNETKKIFNANIASIIERDIFFDNDGKLQEFWSFRLSGPYSVGFRQNEIMVDDLPDLVSTATESADAADSKMGTGDMTLSIVDGKFDGLGPGGTAPSLPVTYLTETTYRCKKPGPCPSPGPSKSKSSIGLFQGYFVGPKDPELVTVTPTDFKLSWKHTEEFPQFSGPPEVEASEIIVTLRRARTQ